MQSAIGFDKTRGDQITVANLQFAQGPIPAITGTAGPGLFDFTRDDLINWAQMLVTLVIALALVFFVMRPLVKRVLAPEGQPLALPVSAEVTAGPGGVMVPVAPGMAPASPDQQMVSADEPPPPDRFPPGWPTPARRATPRPRPSRPSAPSSTKIPSRPR